MEVGIFVGVLLLILSWIIVSGLINDRRKQTQQYERALQPSRRMLDEASLNRSVDKAVVGQYFEHHRATKIIDDVTWADLGMDQVFNSIDLTTSSLGREYLYYSLRTISNGSEEFQMLEQEIGRYTDREFRAGTMLDLSRIGKDNRTSLYLYLDHLNENKITGNVLHISLLLLYIPVIALFWVNWALALGCLLVLISGELLTYFRIKADLGTDLLCLGVVSSVLKVASNITDIDVSALNLTSSKMVSLICGRTSGRNDGNPLTVLLDYVRMLTHIDIILLNQNIREIQNNQELLDKVISRLGYMDMCISISRLRESLVDEQGYCIPDFTSESLQAEALYHPVLKCPVPNSISACREVLITGSNASGKTTFLKTVAVNAILARTIHTVMGKSLAMPYCNIISSLAPADDLIKGTSYYVAEVNSLKRIFDAVGDERVLCLVDEVLRGTNTLERIAASSQILKALSASDYLCMAATHDSELCDLLSDVADNYHFEEDFVEGEIHFSYKIMAGKCQKRNAIKLLERAGFSSDVTNAAEEMVEEFIKGEKWVLK